MKNAGTIARSGVRVGSGLGSILRGRSASFIQPNRFAPLAEARATGLLILRRVRTELRAEPAARAGDERAETFHAILTEVSRGGRLESLRDEIRVGVGGVLDGLLKVLQRDVVAEDEFGVVLP